VAVGSLAPLLAVAACSGDEPITTQGRVSTQSSTAGGTTTGGPGEAQAPSAESSTMATPTMTATGPLWRTANVSIKDPAMGHTITALQVVRNIPWPAGNPVAEESFEIIAVRLEVTAGSRYSAEVNPWLFTLDTSNTRYAQTTTEFGTLLGGPLQTTKRAEKRSGWIYFKVNKGSGSRLQLNHHRPDYTVSTTGKSIPRQTFSVELAK
jgi:hypothetical protein